MKRFLAVYTGSSEAKARWEALDEAQRSERHAAGFKAWGEWVERNKASIEAAGGPLGRTKLVSPAGIADIRNNMAAFTIVRAESHEAAAKLFEQHPHFMLFPGAGVEVMECLPVPSA
jgi:hypothetical protein